MGNQTFPWGCAPWESLMTPGNSLGQIFPDNHCGLSTAYTSVCMSFPVHPLNLKTSTEDFPLFFRILD